MGRRTATPAGTPGMGPLYPQKWTSPGTAWRMALWYLGFLRIPALTDSGEWTGPGPVP
jgi:hypothetical protein